MLGFQAGDSLPAYVHILPRGSRGDVQAKGEYQNGQWTVEICRLLDTGHADDARFQVGTDTVFSIAVTDNSGGTHNGANVVNLVWAGAPGPAVVVVADLAALTLAAPVIDGDSSDAAWAGAAVSLLGFTPQSGDNGVTSATVQAAWLGAFIYFRVTWDDATEHSQRKRWTFDGVNWAQNSDNEDRLYFMFDITGGLGTAAPGTMAGTATPFTTAGCSMSCHGDGVMRTDKGRVDTWHWKATRTDPVGFLDDKYMGAAAPSVNGRHADEGLGAYMDNKDGTGTAPAYTSVRGLHANPDYLCLLPEDHDFAEAKTSDAGFAANDFLPGYVQRPPLNSRADVWARGGFENGDWTVEFCRALDTGSTWEWGSPGRFRGDAVWSNGDTIPGYVSFPPKGSFADVDAQGMWQGGVWTVEIGRDLDTGHPDDVVFDPAGDTMVMSIGITDNSGGTHNGNPVVNLEWAGQAGPTTVVADPTATPPTVDGVPGDAAWAAAQTSLVLLTPQSGANGIVSVEVQAVRTATRIYFKFAWDDLTRNEFREQWTYNAGTWTQNSENEDRLFVMFDIDGALGTSTPGADDGIGQTPFTGVGCTMACHGDGFMRTDSGNIDTWHWKATRNNGSGWLDDKNMIPATAGVSGRKSDEGAGIATRNRNSDQTAPNYQAFADPGANAAHIHLRMRGSPDDAGFVVGRNIPFAFALTDASGGSHDGAPLLTLKWSGVSTPIELVALDLVAAGLPTPDIDGAGADGAWAAATPSIVNITPQSGGGFGIATADLRAVYDRDHIYIRVFWTDPSGTRDVLKNRRVFDGAAWSTTGARNEDRVYFLWGCMGEALGTATAGQADGTVTPFRAVGCAMACHGDGFMRTDSGRLDTWHWKGARTNGLGYSDDKYFTAAALGTSGRKGDFGRSSHSDNGTAAAPAFRAFSGPGANLTYLVERPLSGCHRALALVPPANRAPFAHAGTPQTVGGGVLVTLDGTLSFDPDVGDTITYAWVQTGGTAVVLNGANTQQPTFTSPNVNDALTFDLTVSDGLLQDTATVTVTVQLAVPPVSYATDVHPLWTLKGCTQCHAGTAPAAGMDLGGNPAQTWGMVTAGRVSIGAPPTSLILLKPLDPAAGGVAHQGGIFFPNTLDTDYVTILNWIQQGALNN